MPPNGCSPAVGVQSSGPMTPRRIRRSVAEFVRIRGHPVAEFVRIRLRLVAEFVRIRAGTMNKCGKHPSRAVRFVARFGPMARQTKAPTGRDSLNSNLHRANSFRPACPQFIQLILLILPILSKKTPAACRSEFFSDRMNGGESRPFRAFRVLFVPNPGLRCASTWAIESRPVGAFNPSRRGSSGAANPIACGRVFHPLQPGMAKGHPSPLAQSSLHKSVIPMPSGRKGRGLYAESVKLQSPGFDGVSQTRSRTLGTHYKKRIYPERVAHCWACGVPEEDIRRCRRFRR
jgi:hypothetical protein